MHEGSESEHLVKTFVKLFQKVLELRNYSWFFYQKVQKVLGTIPGTMKVTLKLKDIMILFSTFLFFRVNEGSMDMSRLFHGCPRHFFQTKESKIGEEYIRSLL